VGGSAVGVADVAVVGGMASSGRVETAEAVAAGAEVEAVLVESGRH